MVFSFLMHFITLYPSIDFLFATYILQVIFSEECGMEAQGRYISGISFD